MSDAGALARLGLDADQAARQLATLGHDAEVIEALAAAANPDMALATLARVAEADGRRWDALRAEPALNRAVVVAGSSEALGDVLARDAAAATVLAGDLDEAWVPDTVAARAAEALADAADDPAGDAATALAGFQRRGLLRVAARDLLGIVDTPTAARELSDLAQGVLAAALDQARNDTGAETPIAVIGMGKLGGGELNYVSDVDVLFVHDGDWGQATRLGERFLRLLGQVTSAGRAYDVDTALRPEGKDGPLVRSLDAYSAYYERWAKTWEFQALLKARPIAGDRALGAGFAAMAEPFVWPDKLSAEAVAEIQAMKGVVEGSKEVRRAGRRQVKLAPGGLRDIEFAVQLLQLVHGRHDVTLRTGNTLDGLAALAAGGYVDEGDANLFADAYVFLRTVEHRLQLLRLRRTHTLPVEDAERHRLARAAGFRPIRAAGALEQFDRTYLRVQGSVRRLHEQLFYRPLLARFAQLGAADQVAAPEEGQPAWGLREEAARDRLAALGFANPQGSLRDLAALASGVSRSAALFRTLLPAILPTLAAAPDPDGGLARLRSLAEKLERAPAFLRTLRDSPPVGDLLAQVLGASPVAAEWLARQPDALAGLADAEALDAALGAADYARLADGLLRRGADADALRRLRRREAVRTAVRDLTGRADVAAVGHELSGLAEACLEAAVALVAPDDVRLAVIGMGKLGGAELGYASDLDVLLVGEPAGEVAERAAEELLGLLSSVTPEGQAFRVDLGLRPEGKDGPLVRSLASYEAYYERWGEHWEAQALTQARPVAGDAELGAQFLALARRVAYPSQVPSGRLAAVRQMKARVERDRSAGGPRANRPRVRTRSKPAGSPTAARGERIDLKLGPGGLSDVEWTVQLLQLREGGAVAALREPGTLQAVDSCAEAGLLGQDDARWLRDGWLLQARLRNALYLAGFRRTDQLPAGAADGERVARMLGTHGQALLEDLGRARRRVRKVHERLFYA